MEELLKALNREFDEYCQEPERVVAKKVISLTSRCKAALARALDGNDARNSIKFVQVLDMLEDMKLNQEKRKS